MQIEAPNQRSTIRVFDRLQFVLLTPGGDERVDWRPRPAIKFRRSRAKRPVPQGGEVHGRDTGLGVNRFAPSTAVYSCGELNPAESVVA